MIPSAFVKTLPQQIADARAAAGISLAVLGARVGLSKQFLCDIEGGHRGLATRFWKALAEVLPTLRLEDMAAALVEHNERVEIATTHLDVASRSAVVAALVAEARAA